MSRKVVAGSVISLLLAATLLRAGEPWEEKPYTEWTKEDVEKVLADSPWAHEVWIRVQKSRGRPDRFRMTVDRTFTVQWASASTVREALVRQWQLEGHVSEEEAERYLSAPSTEYIVILRGYDLTDLAPPSLRQALFEKEAMNNIYIQPRQSKQRIEPLRVQFVRQGDRLVAAIVYFPREVDGKAVIGADEVTVTFQCLHFFTGLASITTSFELSKMVRDGKPDL